jgi:hypothetical protein
MNAIQHLHNEISKVQHYNLQQMKSIVHKQKFLSTHLHKE